MGHGNVAITDHVNTILYPAAIHIKGTPAMHINSSVSYKVEWGISEYFSGNWLLFLTGSRY